MASATHAPDAVPATQPAARPGTSPLAGPRVLTWSLRALIALDLALLAAFAAAAIGYRLGVLDGAPHFPLITNSVGLFVLLLAAAGLALADPRRFRPMLLFISLTHAVQLACLAAIAVVHGISGDVSILQLVHLPAVLVAGVWAGAAAAATALFGALWLARAGARAPESGDPVPVERPVGWQRILLWIALAAMALVFAASMVLYLMRGIEGADGASFAFVAASVSKDGLFLALTVLALTSLPRWASMTLVIAVGHFALVASNGLMWSAAAGPAPVFGADPPLGGPAETVLRNWLLIDVVLGIALVAAFWLYQRARYRLRYLSPPAVRAVEAFADALFDRVPDVMGPREVADKLDAYLAAFEGRAKGRIHFSLVALYHLPIGWRLAPFSALSRERRKAWAKRRFEKGNEGGVWPLGPLRRMWRTIIRGAQQMAYVGYYSHPKGQESTGFVPYSQRSGSREAVARVDRDRPGLSVTEPWQVSGREMDADAVVVGSGAAGAIIAYRLAEAGRHVVVLERGPHIAPTQMTEDEMEMFARLYSDGALQLSADFEFQATQGRCVGGSTTVNNAVCLEPSLPTKEEWARRVEDLDLGELDRAFDDVRRFMHVGEQPESVVAPAAHKLVEGLAAEGREAKRVHANIEQCLGCGYCNSGCAYGAKLSMLDSVLVWGQQWFGDRLRIVSECEVRKIVRRDGTARAVKCTLSNGRKLRVNADTVVVSAGAIASSRLLQRSRIGGSAAGRGLTCNIRTALAARFPEPVEPWAGLQMTDYYRPHPKTPWMIESWAVPVMSAALAMPGWFDDHEEYMRDFRRVGFAGVLVGATTEGRVHRLPFLHGGSEFSFKPNGRDLRALKDAFTIAGEALFSGGADEVMVSTHRKVAVERNGNTPRGAAIELRERIQRVIDDSSDVLNLGSSHPQGGNAMSSDPEDGVVDGSCRVHGFRNLYVCDASVFPTSVTVNPQLTVMALAEYTARRMLRASAASAG